MRNRRQRDDGDILDELPFSVSTGRDAGGDRRGPRLGVGLQGESQWQTAHATRPSHAVACVPRLRPLCGARESRRSRTRVDVQLATLTDKAPDGDEWLHEIKFDGYRMIVPDRERSACSSSAATTRIGPTTLQPWQRLQGACRRRRRSSMAKSSRCGPMARPIFRTCRTPFAKARGRHCSITSSTCCTSMGMTSRSCRWTSESAFWQTLVDGRRAAEHAFLRAHRGQRPAFFKQAARWGWKAYLQAPGPALPPGPRVRLAQGEVRAHRRVRHRRLHRSRRSRTAFGALLVGYYNRQGELIYAGRVGTGFDERTLQSLLKGLQPLEQEKSPFSTLKKAKAAHWVKPRLVAQVTFGNWTRDGLLRHPSFQGLRKDKRASDVTRDTPVPISAAVRAQQSKANTKTASRSAVAQRGASRRTHDPVTTAGETGYDTRKQQLAGVRLTSPEKVLYPEAGITKLELANYYRMVADWILPHISDRPLVLVRCPEGKDKACFYQKHPAVGTPDTLRQIPIREKHKTKQYVIVDDVVGLDFPSPNRLPGNPCLGLASGQPGAP